MLGIEKPLKEGDYFVDRSRFTKDYLKIADSDVDRRIAFDDQQRWAEKRPWTSADYPDIAAWLKANEKPLNIVVEAVKRPEYFVPLVASRPDGKNARVPGAWHQAFFQSDRQCREIASALTARAMHRVGEGKFDDAWQDLLACHRLGRLIGRGPSLMEALLGYAIDHVPSTGDIVYLGRAGLTTELLQIRVQDLEALPRLSAPADKLDLYDRFMHLDALQSIAHGDLATLQSMGRGVIATQELRVEIREALVPNAKLALVNLDWEPALRGGNLWFDRMVSTSRLPDRAKAKQEFDKMENELNALNRKAEKKGFLRKLLVGKDGPDKTAAKAIGNILLRMSPGGAQLVRNSRDRAEQVEKNLHVAFALAMYHRDHGRYPVKLDDLAPKYLPAVPGDIFSGKPLTYRPSDNGYLFYSVGINGKDDGGRGYSDDVGCDDLSVRMPLPELRRK